MISLDAFRASARTATPDEAAAEYNDAFFDEAGAARFFLYRDGFFIAEMPDGSFWVPLEGGDFTGPQHECEKRLYGFYCEQFGEIPS